MAIIRPRSNPHSGGKVRLQKRRDTTNGLRQTPGVISRDSWPRATSHRPFRTRKKNFSARLMARGPDIPRASSVGRMRPLSVAGKGRGYQRRKSGNSPLWVPTEEDGHGARPTPKRGISIRIPSPRWGVTRAIEVPTGYSTWAETCWNGPRREPWVDPMLRIGTTRPPC